MTWLQVRLIGIDSLKGISLDLNTTGADLPNYSNAPVSSDVAAAFAKFFYRGAGPSHKQIRRVLIAAGYDDGYEYSPGLGGPTKDARIYTGFNLAQRKQATARKFVEGLLSILRVEGLINKTNSEQSDDERTLRQALGRDGWFISDNGDLSQFGGADLDTGGREALDQQLNRLRKATGDPALLLGTSKEVLESVAKIILVDFGRERAEVRKMSFGELMYLSRERLGVLPQSVDPNSEGHAHIRKLYQSIWAIIDQVNELRNLQGTGHGHDLPIGVPDDLAQLIVKEVCIVAEFMLATLDRQVGNSQ